LTRKSRLEGILWRRYVVLGVSNDSKERVDIGRKSAQPAPVYGRCTGNAMQDILS